MAVRVREIDGGYRIDGDWDGLDAANAFLAHLSGRGFSAATVRAYAFDVLNLVRFLTERKLALAVVDATVVATLGSVVSISAAFWSGVVITSALR